MNKDMEYSRDHTFIPVTSVGSHLGIEVRPDVYSYTVQVVNICFIGNPEKTDGWFLVDAGMPDSAEAIISEAEKRFGSTNRPKAIILTHGHFDHIGAIIDLIEHWNIPVYAHELEIPYLTGKRSYPEPDETVEGGLVAKMSPMFPNEPINLGNHVEKIPADGSIPNLDGWRWLHTPGHSPGHISLFRDEDCTLISGDAFISVRQDSLFKVLMQTEEISGPPRYLTTDWQAAWESVKKLAALEPDIAVTGHGVPMSGEALTTGLTKLVQDFNRVAIPDYGRYTEGTKH